MFALPTRAGAQTSGAPSQPQLLQELTAVPQPGQSGVSATAGVKLQDGRTETKGWSVSGFAAHTTERGHLFRLDVVATQAHFRPAMGRPFQEVEDKQLGTLTYMKHLGSRFSAFGIAGWRRDQILGLKHRVWARAGIGVRAIEHKKAQLFVGPSFALGDESRAHTDQASGVQDVGVLQSMVLQLTPSLSVTEWLSSQFDMSDSDDHHTVLNVSLVARVAKHVGITISYQLHYEALPPPGTANHQSDLTAGVQISFNRSGKKKAGSSP